MAGFFSRLFGGAQGNGKVCPLCGKPLQKSDQYYLDGKPCCTGCYRKKHPENFCAECGRDGTLYVWNGRKYCNTCYEAKKRQEACHVCGCVLTSREGRNRTVLIPGKEIICCNACWQEIQKRGITRVDQLVYLSSQRSSERPKSAQESSRHGILLNWEMEEERRKKAGETGSKRDGYERDRSEQGENGPESMRDLLPALEASVIPEAISGGALRESILEYKEVWHEQDSSPTPENRERVARSLRQLTQTLEKTPLLVPVAFQKELPEDDACTIYYTLESAAILSTLEMVRLIREEPPESLRDITFFMPNASAGEARRVTFIRREGEGAVADPARWDIKRFDGGDGWRYGGNIAEIGPWRFRLVEALGKVYAAVYTGIPYVRPMFEREAMPHLAVISVENVIAFLKNAPDVEGIIVNPNSESHCMLNRELIIPKA